ncbi:VOC family protein [Brevibacterium jeotgali]|uniref:VOC domain-containing protein n=1 Tax=Brevibacterium jeotgali TaxID=1262550 RepID=A0A2H1L787_9MICO|nr:VOC family protein [Brevibacterium jeotgali]TWC03203.1 hypothetical protein FB108_1919 [Brevibacterium jeotgali]SMY12739.1 hypothetical protein BJEO58_02342 [Brevibacterium jeotgali]
MSMTIGASVYLNLPISDVAAARAFWTAAGVRISEPYSNESAVALSFSDHVMVMLLRRDFYSEFLTGRAVADTKTTSSCLICLDAGSKEDVDAFVDAAVAAGGSEVPPPDPNPAQAAIDEGLMYGRTFFDPDGHSWEILWMSGQMPEG